MRGLDTAFPFVRPGLSLSGVGRRSCDRPRRNLGSSPCRGPALAAARLMFDGAPLLSVSVTDIQKLLTRRPFSLRDGRFSAFIRPCASSASRAALSSSGSIPFFSRAGRDTSSPPPSPRIAQSSSTCLRIRNSACVTFSFALCFFATSRVVEISHWDRIGDDMGIPGLTPV
jgi:hypothetical protein